MIATNELEKTKLKKSFHSTSPRKPDRNSQGQKNEKQSRKRNLNSTEHKNNKILKLSPVRNIQNNKNKNPPSTELQECDLSNSSWFP